MQSQASREEQLCRPTSPNPLAPHKRRVELSDGSVTSKQQQQQSIMSNKENRKESEQKVNIASHSSQAPSSIPNLTYLEALLRVQPIPCKFNPPNQCCRSNELVAS